MSRHMSMTTERLIEKAHDYWDNGHRIPLDLFSLMAQEGLDVEALEEANLKEPA